MYCKKYYDIRKQFNDGDIILYHATDFVSTIISKLDDAFYTHCGIVKWVGSRLFTINAGNNGIEFVPLSNVMKKHQQFCVLRIKNRDAIIVDLSVDGVFDLFDRKTVNYKWSLVKTLWRKHILTNAKQKMLTKTCTNVCEYLMNNLEVECYKNGNLTSPQDLIRKLDEKEVEVIYDFSKI